MASTENSGQDLGLFITLAIAVHNIPEGLAISLVLVPRGVGVARAALWSVFSSLPQPLMAVPAFLFIAFFEPVLVGDPSLPAPISGLRVCSRTSSPDHS